MITGVRTLLAGLVIALAAAALAGCASVSDDALESSLAALQVASSPTPVPSVDPQGPAGCVASLRPQGPLPRPRRMPAGTLMRTIQERGELRVGVDQTTLRFAAWNPWRGRIEGLEIDILRQVANAIFGSPNRIRYIAIASAERAAVIKDRRVDIVANLMTITCKRSRDVAFTTVYYQAAQRVLVSRDSPARSVDDLAGRPVCATRASTSLEYLRDHTDVRPYPVRLRTDCLVALQQDRVAAISTDDAILYGFLLQDPDTKLIGATLTKEPWGMAINKANPEFVRFVNAVLERIRRDGTWASIHEHWLGGITRQPAPPPPRARYSD